MLIPANQEAITVEKLKRDNVTMQEQIEGFQKSIAENSQTILALTPIGVWEEIPDPVMINPASNPPEWHPDLDMSSPLFTGQTD